MILRFRIFHLVQALILVALLSPWFARGQAFSPDQKFARSISGQFIVYGPPKLSSLASSPNVAADKNLVRLEPALLVISAERIKDALGRRLEVKPKAPWRGQIYLVVHPARALDEPVSIIAKQIISGWDYRVELPDVLSRTRFTRALTGVLLLEMANRNAQARSAEVPAWLVDGLAGELLSTGSPEFIFSTPDKVLNGIPVTRINSTQRGLDSMTDAQRILQNQPPLTFEQLSWPTGAQQDGKDGGVYCASAQIFTSLLLDLKNGPSQMRTFLESLPQFYNWQLAFRSAFRANFSSLLDLEKWWAVQAASFAVRDPGPLWTPAASAARLDELLRVPVEARSASNNLPAHAEISLQAVIRSMESARQTEILRLRLRDLGLAQFRMAPAFAALTGEYRRALAGYLGENPARPGVTTRQERSAFNAKKISASVTLKKLDELDARRRTIESNRKNPSSPAGRR
ncbi:MAG: hypothetical protein WDN00_00205 [Limisphaerales bacterium]